jgi:hypothetical protein
MSGNVLPYMLQYGSSIEKGLEPLIPGAKITIFKRVWLIDPFILLLQATASKFVTRGGE